MYIDRFPWSQGRSGVNNETAAILVYRENPGGIWLFSYVKKCHLFLEICIAADRVSENDLFIKEDWVFGQLLLPN